MFYYQEGDNLGNHTATTTLNMGGKTMMLASGISLLNFMGWRSESTRSVFHTLSADALYINNTGSIGLAQTPALNSSGTYVLVWDPTSKVIQYRPASGLAGSGGGGGGSGTLSLDTVGAGTHADPMTERNLQYVAVSGGTTTIDARSVVTWSQGQAGVLIADGTMANQPRFVVPSGYQVELCQVMVTLGKPGIDDTTLQITITNDAGGTTPTPGSPASTLTVPSGTANMLWTALHGTTLNSMQHVQTRVDVAGTNAESLSIQFWGKTTACG